MSCADYVFYSATYIHRDVLCAHVHEFLAGESGKCTENPIHKDALLRCLHFGERVNFVLWASRGYYGAWKFIDFKAAQVHITLFTSAHGFRVINVT